MSQQLIKYYHSNGKSISQDKSEKLIITWYKLVIIYMQAPILFIEDF